MKMFRAKRDRTSFSPSVTIPKAAATFQSAVPATSITTKTQM